MLKVTMIGTGSAFSKKFHNTSALVNFPGGYGLLLDCGHSVPKGLYEQGISLMDVDGIFISHLHADHIGGLEEVALYNKFVLGGRKIDLFVPHKLAVPLWECLEGGLGSEGNGLGDYFNTHILYAPVQKVSPHPAIDYIPLKIFTTDHVKGMDTYALGIGDHLFYSADTLFDIKLIQTAAEEYNFIFHDCQMSGYSKNNVHACIEEMLSLPLYMQKRIFLMHYGDNVEEFIGKTGDMTLLKEGDTWVVQSKNKTI